MHQKLAAHFNKLSNKKMSILSKRLLFYWASSFALATTLYYVLWVIMPFNYVFGMLFRMFLYHWEHPVAFIAIPCFFYGIIASLLANKFAQQNLKGKILLTLLIISLTVLVSSPFGGILWHYYDMKAGYFPSNWLAIMLGLGIEWGIEFGWQIVLRSIPYNIIGSILCYFLTQKGTQLFKTA
jgi:hypothetical protein